ncbi:MAG: preprotein translocase subunit SecA [Clostridia bacterium]
MGLFDKIFPSYNEKELKKIEKTVVKIEALAEQFAAKSDDELKAMTAQFKERFANGETLDQLLPEAFATMREASERVLSMRHYHVQLIGGVVLYQGRIAEMKTGEGKTLVATLPAYLNALTGKGVHIVTVNDYLAKRDAEWMGKVFTFLGLTVGVNISQMSTEEKRAAYNCDILYSTNNELGFDYLRDNMVKSKENCVQRELSFAIVDEVDSILIDEARTPLIISGRSNKSSETYITANRFVKTLQDDDYEIGEKEKSIYLNENGAAKAETYFHIENLTDYENQDLKHYIDNALKAHFIMKKESNYIVMDGEVIIVDEFTGRQMIGRRYSDGLHQAIEAKENVQIRSEDKTLATITFQNFFRLYRKLSGMTGTAKTEESEFEGIYKLDVIELPPNKPVIRIDEKDKLYTTIKGKYDAVIADVIDCSKRQQPVLVGTVSVDKSEELSRLLTKQRVAHKVLNAKNHEQEAEIVAQAGKKGSVTIATNMAGRGTDILLGGNPEFLAKQKLANMGYPHDIIEKATSYAKLTDEEIIKAREDYLKFFKLFEADTSKEKEEVIALGGLRIVGTERHESRRIDNQLRGRSGRQGDPGSSVFYLSMEDDLMRVFGGETMLAVAQKFDLDPNYPIQNKLITKQIESAQARVEDRNFSIRKHVIGYDDVMNKQRTVIYEQRRMVLDGMRVHEQILAMMRAVVEGIVPNYIDYNVDYTDWDYEKFNKELESNVLENDTNFVTPEMVLANNSAEALSEVVYNKAVEQYQAKVETIKAELGIDFDTFEKDCLLYNVDNKWNEHIDAMDELKQGIGLVAYAQRDPVMVFKKEGADMFNEMIEAIQRDTVRVLAKSKFERETKTAVKEQKEIKTNEKIETVHRGEKIGRNDLCPCGSGKKYKNCCGKE